MWTSLNSLDLTLLPYEGVRAGGGGKQVAKFIGVFKKPLTVMRWLYFLVTFRIFAIC